MGSGKNDPVLRGGDAMMSLKWQHTITKILIASSLTLAHFQGGEAAAQSSDAKKSGLDPAVAASSPGSKSAMTDSGVQKAIPPKADLSKVNSAKGSDGAKASNTASDSDKETLPFPVISVDALPSLPGCRPSFARIFPSAIDIRGNSQGVVLHARKDTKYDLLSPLSIWLEEGPLLVSVKHPSDLVLVATKFGDICVTAGGDALVDRADETVRIVNLSANDTVFLNMHDKLWTGSPWGQVKKPPSTEKTKEKSKRIKRTYEEIESGSLSIEPGFELIIGSEPLTIEEVKRQDGIGRRDFRTISGGVFVLAEISLDNLAQQHELIKNLKDHGGKASSVYNEIAKAADRMKSKQGDAGFEKVLPPPPKQTTPRKPPALPPKAPPTTTISKPKSTNKTPPPATTQPPAKQTPSSTPPATTGPSTTAPAPPSGSAPAPINPPKL